MTARAWFAHQFESEAYNLSTDPYISSWGRIAHQILAHNCLQEAAKKKKKKKKRVLSGWLFLVLGSGKSRGERGYLFIYVVL